MLSFPTLPVDTHGPVLQLSQPSSETCAAAPPMIAVINAPALSLTHLLTSILLTLLNHGPCPVNSILIFGGMNLQLQPSLMIQNSPLK